jgi:predicted dehydrogenase
MDKIKISIVGLGGITQITHLPVLSKMEGVEIVSVCDIDKAKARNIANKYNIKHFSNNLEELLKTVEADLLIVASPTHVHRDNAITGLENGLHVLVEKPLARNYNEAKEIVEAAKKAKKNVMVGMNTRFRPDIMMQESFLSANEIGEIFYIKAGFLKKRSTIEKWIESKEQSGGGVFLDLGVVLLDIALWVLKFPKIKSVSAVNFFHTFKNVEDSSFVMLRFENNATVTLETSWTLHRENDLFYFNVYGKEGSSSINPLRIYKKIQGTLVNITPIKIETPSNIFKRSYEYELQYFLQNIRNSETILSNGEEAMQRMQIVDAVYKSAKLGREVYFK